MATRIQGVYPAGDKFKVVDIFGYATRGLPGIEIVGLGRYGRPIKEKFVYLSRLQQLKIPPRRYLICAELKDSGQSDNIKWLELPLLMMFWSLADQLPIRNLDDCFCAGKVSVGGRVTNLEFERAVLEKVGATMSGVGHIKYIAPEDSYVPESILHLSIEGLLKGKEMICQ